MLDALAFWWGVVGFVALFRLMWWINDAAERAERIYHARHRDHSKVPPIK